MAQAVITLEDDQDGSLDVSIDFGNGAEDESKAHHAAVKMLQLYQEWIASLSKAA